MTEDSGRDQKAEDYFQEHIWACSNDNLKKISDTSYGITVL